MKDLTPIEALNAIQDIRHSGGTAERHLEQIDWVLRVAFRRQAVLEAIIKYEHNGKIAVVESGRDCDGVEYDGHRRVIDATVDAFYALEDEIGEYADGPFHLQIVPFNMEVERTSRDLVMEAHENGHRHSIVSRFP